MQLWSSSDLAITDLNAYSCKEKKYTIDHYTNFLWCKEHDQANAIEDLEQLHAENPAGAAFEARVSELLSRLAHISNPSEHTKLMLSLRAMNFSADITTNSISARVVRVYASAEPEEMTELFDYMELHGNTLTPCDHLTQGNSRDASTRRGAEPKILHCGTLRPALSDSKVLISRVVVGAQSTTALKNYENTKPGGNYTATVATHNLAWRKLCAVYGHTKLTPSHKLTWT